MNLWRLCLVTGVAIFLLGCFRSSPPVHFYVLASPPEYTVPAGSAGPTGTGGASLNAAPGVSPRVGPRVGILPITLPGYLQRSQMVVRDDDSVDIKMEDFHRWGEDLGLGIARVLSVSMTNSLSGVQGVAMPLRTGAPVDLRVQVDVRRFEGRPEGQVSLEALWVIQKGGVAVREGHFLAQAQAGSSLAALVETQSGLLVKLGAQLADGVLAVGSSENAAPCPESRQGPVPPGRALQDISILKYSRS